MTKKGQEIDREEKKKIFHPFEGECPKMGSRAVRSGREGGKKNPKNIFLTKEFLPSSAQDTTMPDLLDRNDDLREYFFGHWKGLGGSFVRSAHENMYHGTSYSASFRRAQLSNVHRWQSGAEEERLCQKTPVPPLETGPREITCGGQSVSCKFTPLGVLSPTPSPSCLQHPPPPSKHERGNPQEVVVELPKEEVPKDDDDDDACCDSSSSSIFLFFSSCRGWRNFVRFSSAASIPKHHNIRCRREKGRNLRPTFVVGVTG